ncbi:MAG TPA: hypothetical protein VK997_03820 [Deferrisomatales bacterium]|nr:hypothetical protein [Deferrisomatales bacterium]
MLCPLRCPPADPESVAFVIRCFLLRAVAVEELREWAEQILADSEDWPMFVEGLAEFDGVGEEVYHMLGFVPERAFTPAQDAALAGIAYDRGRVPRPGSPGEAAAREALGAHPALADEFRRAFAFLRWEEGVAAECNRR